MTQAHSPRTTPKTEQTWTEAHSLSAEPQPFAQDQRGEVRFTADIPSLTAGGGKPGEGFPAVLIPDDETDIEVVCFHATQTPIDGPDAPSLGASASIGIQHGPTVRRLTPLERERLMGWPDDYTAWGVNDHGERVNISDAARDRLTGNGVVTPVAHWIADRITQADNHPTTLDSCVEQP